MDKPQIIAHVQKSMNYTLFDCRWVPCSAKFVVLGNHARGTGALQIYEMSHGDISLVHEVITALLDNYGGRIKCESVKLSFYLFTVKFVQKSCKCKSWLVG